MEDLDTKSILVGIAGTLLFSGVVTIISSMINKPENKTVSKTDIDTEKIVDDAMKKTDDAFKVVAGAMGGKV